MKLQSGCSENTPNIHIYYIIFIEDNVFVVRSYCEALSTWKINCQSCILAKYLKAPIYYQSINSVILRITDQTKTTHIGVHG